MYWTKNVTGSIIMVSKIFALYEASGMLVLSSETQKALYFHAETEYPEECCGILLGKREKEKKFVYKAICTENVGNKKLKTTHFVMDPLEIAKTEASAEQEGLEIVGFYHSHPNYAASASREDAFYMLAGYSYPIISISDGAYQMACFEKGSPTSVEVKEEKIMIQGET